MSALFSLFQTPERLLDLEPEELAALLMEYLNGLSTEERRKLNMGNFVRGVKFGGSYNPEVVRRVVAEAWAVCKREGFLAEDPDSAGWDFITRRGQKVRNQSDLTEALAAKLLRRELLHPKIAEQAWPDFIRGNYESAVFSAFKEVEVAVRAAGGFSDREIGTDLMRKAFDSKNGPLTDQLLQLPEREAMAHLFAGAIGLLKNPSSHRHVAFDDAEEAAELIGLASYLMRIVDSRRVSRPSTSG
jgi:uncharacterized protein (TIGR02391 family)